MASTFTTSLNLEEPARGDYVNSWDLPANSNYSQIDNAFGNVASLTLTNGTVTLTQAQANCVFLSLGGTLTGNVTIVYPATQGPARKICVPNCVMGGFKVSIIGGAGADTIGIFFNRQAAFLIPFVLTHSRAFWDYGGFQPGLIASYPISAVPNGWLVCDGTLYSTTQYDQLFSIIGYAYGGSGASFGVPDYRGYALVGSDNMGGPAGNAGRFFNFGPSGIAGELVHVLTANELAVHNHAVSDPGHTHGASQAPHSHGGVVTTFGVGGNFAAGAGWALTIGRTDTQQPAITVNGAVTGITVAAAGANVGHNNVQPSRTTNKYIRW